jgi:hypothetical protein
MGKTRLFLCRKNDHYADIRTVQPKPPPRN